MGMDTEEYPLRLDDQNKNLEMTIMVYEIPAAEPAPEELASECSKAADNAVEWVSSMSGIELEFSPQSLVILDKVLNELIPSLSDDEHDSTVILIGSYFGEVMLRAMGGRWETGDVFAGPGLRGLSGKDLTISPFSIVRRAFKSVEPHYLAVNWNDIVKKIRKADDLEDTSGFNPAPSDPALLLPVNEGESSGASLHITSDELAKNIADETNKFIGFLKDDLGFELDYSIESLKFIDAYISSLNEKMSKEGKKTETRVFLYLLGNYIGEVLRKNFSGKWVYLDSDQTAGLIFDDSKPNGNTIFPHQVAAKFAFNYKEGEIIKYVRDLSRKIQTV
jgi:hypothetical protein